MLLYEADGHGTKRTLCLEGFANGTVSLQRCDTNTNRNQLWRWNVYPPYYDVVVNRTLHTSNYHKELRKHYGTRRLGIWVGYYSDRTAATTTTVHRQSLSSIVRH